MIDYNKLKDIYREIYINKKNLNIYQINNLINNTVFSLRVKEILRHIAYIKEYNDFQYLTYLTFEKRLMIEALCTNDINDLKSTKYLGLPFNLYKFLLDSFSIIASLEEE